MPWQRQSGTSPVYRSRAHKQARAAAVKAFREGDLCVLCLHPMYGPTRHLHLDHDPDGNGYRGLAHGSAPCEVCGLRCNVVDGARRGRARQSGWDPRPAPRPRSRIW